MCGRNGLDVALMDNSGMDEGNGMIVVERNGIVENSVVDAHESDVERNGRDVARNESDVAGGGRDGNVTVNVTSDLDHSIFQVATLARKMFPQLFQPGRKLDFTHRKLLEKPESDKGNEVEIIDDHKIQLLDSLLMQHCRLTNLEIKLILAIRASWGSNRACTYIFDPIPGRPSYLFPRKIAKPLID